MGRTRHVFILVVLILVAAGAEAQAQIPTSSTTPTSPRAGDGPTCPATPAPGNGTGAFLLRLRINNRGGPETTRICMFGVSGTLLYNQTLRVPPGTARSFEVYVSDVPDRILIEHATAPNREAVGLARGFLACPPGGAAFDYAYASTILVMAPHDGCVAPDQATAPGQSGTHPSAGLLIAAGSAAATALLMLILWASPKRFRIELWVLFSRILGPRILDHPTRSQIRAAVEVDPGVRAHELVARLELPTTTLAFHLAALRRARVLTTVGSGLAPRYFVAGQFSRAEMVQRAALRNPSLKQFREVVAVSPGISLSAAARAAGLSRARASKMARRLEALGLLRRSVEGRHLRLFLPSA